MKTKAIVASAIIALFLVGAMSVSFAHSGSDGGDDKSQQTTQTNLFNESNVNENNQIGGILNNFAPGDVFTVPSQVLVGHFVSVNNPLLTGVASGTFTFEVTGVFQTGFTAAITSGHITLDSTTVNVTGGTVVFSPDGESGTGSGTAGTAHFIIQIHESSDEGAVRIDLKNGTSEFLITLGMNASSGDSSGGSMGTSSGGFDGSGDSSGHSSGS